jgi:hypothetical protein
MARFDGKIDCERRERSVRQSAKQIDERLHIQNSVASVLIVKQFTSCSPVLGCVCRVGLHCLDLARAGCVYGTCHITRAPL